MYRMKDVNRIVIFIVIIGLLYSLYKYQENMERDQNEKIVNTNQNNINNQSQPQIKEPETEYEDNMTLGSLVEVETYNTQKSSNSEDSLFN